MSYGYFRCTKCNKTGRVVGDFKSYYPIHTDCNGKVVEITEDEFYKPQTK